MPKRDAFGKQPSGQQNRKRRREKAAQVAIVQELETGDRAKLLAEIGDVPLDDPSTAMEWFRRAQLVMLRELFKDPTVSLKELFGAVKQMSEAAGKTRDGAALEARLVGVEKAIDGTRAKGAVEVKATHGLVRPPTARGGSRAGRPRAVETPPTRPDGA